MTTRRRYWAVLLVLLAGPALCCAEMVWDGSQWVQPKAPEPGTPAFAIQIIRQHVSDGANEQAIELAEEFLVKHADSPLCEEALCLAGQAELNRGHYWDAYKWFERQIASYPNGPYYERALDREFIIGDAFLNGRRRRVFKILRLSAIDEGIDILMRISTHAPGTELGERALLRVADHHFNHQQYPEAIKVYDEFVQQNPSSTRRPYAMLQAARANLLNFRGVRYDETPLLEAAERFRVFAQAYPQAGRKENIPGILEDIRLSLAHKVFHAGQFYQRTHHPRAAVYYYRRVLAEYSDTHWAGSAQDKLDQLTGYEPLAPQDAPPPPSETDAVATEPPAQAPPAEEPTDQPSAAQAPPEDTRPKTIHLEDLPNQPFPAP